MTGRAVDTPRLVSSFFFPRRIAIAGLSPRPDSWGRAAATYLRDGRFTGDILAYRPRRPDPDFPAIEDFGDAGPVDLLLVALPAEAAIEAVRDAAGGGVGATIVFSSGFAEAAGGQVLQQRLVEAAGDMPVLGPNCLGVVSDPGNVVASVSGYLGRERASGPVALISQSGAMGFVLAQQLASYGLGFSYYASTGNEAVLGAADLVGAVAGMPEVRVIGCYLEGIRSVAAWRAACRKAAEAGQRVVALKIGSSAAAQRAALSHTAAAAGEAELFEAVCREDGVVLARDEVEFAQQAVGLTSPVDLPDRPGLAVITMSGGAGAVIADRVASCADLPELSAATQEQIRGLGVSLAGTANPVDLSGMFVRHLGKLRDLVEIVGADDAIDAVVLYFTFGDSFAGSYRELIAELRRLPVPAWFVWAGAPAGEVEAQAGKANVVASIPALVSAIAANCGGGASGAEALLAQRRQRTVCLPPARVHTEASLAPALAAAGLPYVPMAAGATPEQVLGQVQALGLAAPWAVKADHPGAPHRDRLGLVRLNIRDIEELTTAVHDVLSEATAAGLDGARVVVEPMVTATGLFSLGALRHPEFGEVVTLGPGGSRVEDPAATRVAACLPLSGRGLTALHDGAGRISGQPVDAGQLADAVMALEALLRDVPSVQEADINPVLITSRGLIAVDALAAAD